MPTINYSPGRSKVTAYSSTLSSSTASKSSSVWQSSLVKSSPLSPPLRTRGSKLVSLAVKTALKRAREKRVTNKIPIFPLNRRNQNVFRHLQWNDFKTASLIQPLTWQLEYASRGRFLCTTWLTSHDHVLQKNVSGNTRLIIPDHVLLKNVPYVHARSAAPTTENWFLVETRASLYIYRL